MSGFALGAWGGVQATAAGLAIGASGMLRDVLSGLAEHGELGTGVNGPAVSYLIVYQIEIVLLFATLAVIGPMVRSRRGAARQSGFGLAHHPG